MRIKSKWKRKIIWKDVKSATSARATINLKIISTVSLQYFGLDLLMSVKILLEKLSRLLDTHHWSQVWRLSYALKYWNYFFQEEAINFGIHVYSHYYDIEGHISVIMLRIHVKNGSISANVRPNRVLHVLVKKINGCSCTEMMSALE